MNNNLLRNNNYIRLSETMNNYWYLPFALIFLIKFSRVFDGDQFTIPQLLRFWFVFTFNIILFFRFKQEIIEAFIKFLKYIDSSIYSSWYSTKPRQTKNFIIEKDSKSNNITRVFKKVFYINVERRIVIRNQHNYYVSLDSKESEPLTNLAKKEK